MTQEQPTPAHGAQSVAVTPALLRVLSRFDTPSWIAQALEARTLAGVERYGAPLHSHNGRDSVRDLREELLDAMQYLAQAHIEGRISAPVYVPALEALLSVTIILGEPTPKETNP